MQTARKKTKFFDTLRSIYTNGGVSRFWRGSMLIGTASVPAHSLYFSIYEIMKKKMGVNEAVRKEYIKLGLSIRGICSNWCGCNFLS